MISNGSHQDGNKKNVDSSAETEIDTPRNIHTCYCNGQKG